MKYMFSSLLLFLTAMASHAQNIRGTVTTSDGKPASGATVTLDSRQYQTTNDRGQYSFEKIKNGTHTLLVEFISQQAQSRTITIKSGETATADFTLLVNANQLEEVTIVGNKYSVAAKKRSESVARLLLSNLENPQVYNVIDKELIREQSAITLEESFRNVPGAAPAKTGAGIPAFFSRGFSTSDNLRNGMATYLRTGIDLSLVERVETIKGPSSTLFGGIMTSFGGVVNYITKKPYETFGGEISYTQGSFDLNRLTADINTPLNKEQGIYFRMNMALQSENSFQDQGQGNTFVIAPSLLYKVNDRLTLSLDADMQRFRGTSYTAWQVGAVPVTSYEQLKLNYKRSLIDNSFIGNQYSNNAFFRAEYKLSDNWTSTTNYAWGTGGYNDLFLFTNTWATDTTVSRAVGAYAPDKLGRKQLQQNFTGDFTIGNMRNRLVAGIDYLDQYRNIKFGSVTLDTVNTLRTAGDIRLTQFERLLSTVNMPVSISRQITYSVYVSDVLNLTDHLSVMASLRADRFINKGTTNNLTQITSGAYNQNALSPKFGIVFQPVLNKISLFANYMNGFKNVANATQPDGTVTSFKPQYANQWEAGAKLELFKDRLSATISYYDINITNNTRPQLIGSQTFTVQDGTQNSKGLEAEIIGHPARGLNFIAGYGYNDNQYTLAAANLLGKRTVGMPRNTGNLWISYTITTGKVKGLGLGAGASYNSDVFLNAANTFTLPAYTTLDATVFYSSNKLRFSAKVNNMTDQQYWISDGFYSRPQKTINFLTSVAFKF